MFIDKLKNEDAIMLIKKFVKTINKNDEIEDWFKFQLFDGFINVCFSVNGSPCSCRFQDYAIRMSYGTIEQQEHFTNIYREFMYKLFGERYTEGIKKYYTEEQYQK